MSQQQSPPMCLQDALTWDLQQCQQNIHPLLNCLLERLEEEFVINEVFDVISTKLLLILPHEDLEEKILVKFTAQLQHKFDACLEQLTIEGAAQDVILNALQECELALKYSEQSMTSLQQTSQHLPYSHLHSLPPLVLHMVEGSVGFCKESEQIYTAKMFASISKQLSSLFSQATRLYKMFLELLQQLTMDMDAALPQVLGSMHRICHLMASLDMKLSVTSLKVIARLSLEHRQVLENEETGTITSIIAALCADTVDTMEYIASNQRSEGSCGSHIKVAGFKLKVIASLVDSFASLAPLPALVTLLGMYHRYMHDEFSVSVQKLLAALVSKQQFSEEIVARNTSLSDHPKARLLLLMDIMSTVTASSDDIVDLWMHDDTHNLFREVLSTIRKGSILTVTSSDTALSTYERCCCLLSTLAARVSPQHFSHVEHGLLETVLGSSGVASILATDVWAFLARYSTVDVCMAQCVSLCRMLCCVPGNGGVPAAGRLHALLHRLTKFLPPQQQEELVSMFPLSNPDHIPLWSSLPLSGQHAASVSAQCKHQLQTIVRQGYLTPKDNTTLSTLLPACEADSALVEVAVEALSGSLPSSLTSALLTLLASSSQLSKDQHDKVLKVPCGEPEVGVAMLRYLRAHLPNTSAVCPILNALLLSPVPAISLDARAVFADFASATQHEATVTQCVHADSRVHDIVVQYFNQLAGSSPVPEVEEASEKPVEEEEGVMDCVPPTAKWYNPNTKQKQRGSSGPPAPVSGAVLDAVLDIQQGVTALQQLSSLPPQAASSLSHLRDSMSSIVQKLS